MSMAIIIRISLRVRMSRKMFIISIRRLMGSMMIRRLMMSRTMFMRISMSMMMSSVCLSVL